MISALRGGSGKTIFSIGIIAALRNRGVCVAPFKKGPDYIDAGWLALAAGRPCYNLDSFLIDPHVITESYHKHTRDLGFALIEGNRGLYDCIDTDGLTSTAELAKLLDLPVVLVLDATKTTRTLAAVVGGCLAFDPQAKIKGIILNQVAGARHEKIARDSIAQYCGIPVLGAVPKLKKQRFPERHMGLVPTYEHQWAHDAVAAIAELAEKYLDLQTIAAMTRVDLQTAGSGPLLSVAPSDSVAPPAVETVTASGERPRVGVIHDSAFQFYYPENIDALVQAGARVVITSPLHEDSLPPVDALYIGGGFPETHAARLVKNLPYREQIRNLARKGLPVYAECGGLMYLGRELILDEGVFPMCGVLPVSFGFSKRPQGHGYTIFRVARDNPYFRTGEIIRGHEFHYSTVQACDADSSRMAFDMQRGNGISNGRDGLCIGNVLATYNHIHALGTPQWAPALVEQARRFRTKS